MARKSDARLAGEAGKSAYRGVRPYFPNRIIEWLGVAVALAIIGIIVAIALSVSGVIPLTVRGNWPPFVSTFLHTTYLRSVEFHGDFVDDPPDLTETALIERGGGHFGTTCVFCHGGPGVSPNAVSNTMEPAPPHLWEVNNFGPKGNFYLIDKGLAMSPMPAWPVRERDDEVWAMVAFVEQLPDMSREEFLSYTRGETVAPDAEERMQTAFARGGADEWPLSEQTMLIESCARCHGFDGQGRPSGAFPNLAIQPKDYLAEMLTDYASGRKRSGIMRSVAITLTPEEMDKLAGYYAQQPAGEPATPEVSDDVLARGRELALQGAPDQNVQPCAGCHGTVAASADMPYFPVLAGQHANYLEYRLKVWRRLRPEENVWNRAMSYQAHGLTDEDIRAVSAWYASKTQEEVRQASDLLSGAAPGTTDTGGDGDTGAAPAPTDAGQAPADRSTTGSAG